MTIPDAAQAHPTGQRSVAPIRWPRPSAAAVALVLLWVLGGVVGVLVPSLIVPPQALSAPGGALAAAFGFTALGVVLMCVAGVAGARREGHAGVLVAAVTPSIALLIGGLAMVGSKLFPVTPV
ncbi:hypothetical protein [Quadrisphaera sp. DSM 44207]|uniref:hypothetical protein n=1 Tax=Quadrisphaera sp. DSM 44207 TaxID=1881057 RepID=UPI000B84BC2F|nr:hypothetical protein [Quadrisphaera sp. DSM 44207]